METLERVYLSICPVATVIAAGLIIYAVLTRGLTPLHGAYLVLLFAIFALTFTLFLFYSFRESMGYRLKATGVGWEAALVVGAFPLPWCICLSPRACSPWW